MTLACISCNKPVDVPATEEELQAWHSGELIQDAMPELTPGQREMLLNQICEECFDRMFGEEK